MQPNIRFLSLHFLVLSLLYQAMVSVDACPRGCFCMRKLIDCTSPAFPLHLPSGVVEVMNIRGEIANIPANAFVQPNESVLEILSINQHEILKIEPYAFNNLFAGHVAFYNVQIKHLEPRAFSNLTCTSLSIYNAVVDVMPASLFEGLTSESLGIYNNNITTLATNVFKSSTVRKNAAFYHNKIDTVQKNAFSANFLINIYLNKIKTFLIQESVVPKSFHSNRFQCSCTLIWMWKADSAFKDFLDSNTCSGPSQVKALVLRKMNQSLLCNGVNSHTSEWEQITTISNTRKLESSQPTAKETPGGVNSNRNPTVTASTNQTNATKKLAMNMLMIVSAVTCFLFYFESLN